MPSWSGTSLLCSEAGRLPHTRAVQKWFSSASLLLSWRSALFRKGDCARVLPELVRPAEEFSQHIIISYAGGYDYQTLKPFIVGILVNCASADLVLLVPEGSSIPDLPEELRGRVHLQHHALPDVDDPDLLPHPVSLRFYVATAFLRKLTAAGHRGHVFLSDSRDVFVQRNMFVDPFLDDLLHFPRESGAYRLRGPFSLNADWVTQCYGRTTLSALGGFYVMNSGTLLGPSHQMLQYFDIMLAEFSKRWHCRRLHGSDQAIHNYLLYTGKLVGSGLEFQVEEMETGRFASVAWTHGAMLDFVDVDNETPAENVTTAGATEDAIAVTLPPATPAPPVDPGPKIAVLSALSKEACTAPGGDLVNYLSVVNKQDYARLHDYVFILGTHKADPKLENMWNKIAWINKVLEETELEWLLWVDLDTVIIDASFVFPFKRFRDADLVVYGDEDGTRAGDPAEGLNSGMMLIRNSPWSKEFFRAVGDLGRLDDHQTGGDSLKKVLLTELTGTYSDGYRDQNAIIYLLKKHADEYIPHVEFVGKEFCFNCFWKDLLEVTAGNSWELELKTFFAQHYMGCQSCNGQNRDNELDLCLHEFKKAFKFAVQRQIPAFEAHKHGVEREASLQRQLIKLPYCKLDPDAPLCQSEVISGNSTAFLSHL
eukprot:jgi/Astpho2/9694/fgenesh1_pg.00149_%23_4_t